MPESGRVYLRLPVVRDVCRDRVIEHAPGRGRHRILVEVADELLDPALRGAAVVIGEDHDRSVGRRDAHVPRDRQTLARAHVADPGRLGHVARLGRAACAVHDQDRRLGWRGGVDRVERTLQHLRTIAGAHDDGHIRRRRHRRAPSRGRVGAVESATASAASYAPSSRAPAASQVSSGACARAARESAARRSRSSDSRSRCLGQGRDVAGSWMRPCTPSSSIAPAALETSGTQPAPWAS